MGRYHLHAVLTEQEAADLPAFVEALERGEVPETVAADMIVNALRVAVAGEEGSLRKVGYGDHLDFVHVVETEGADSRAFGEAHAAQRFAAACNHGHEKDKYPPTWIAECEVYVGPPAERLIASERGDVLEGMGFPRKAEKFREGALTPASLMKEIEHLADRSATPVDDSHPVYRLLQQWAEEDARACTGAVVDGKVQHDGPTCPVHEEDAKGGDSNAQ